MELYAHSPNVRGRWHGLVEHLRGSGALAGVFAAPFGASDFAWFCGVCHDLGKASWAWQRRLLEVHRRGGGRVGIDHKSLGAEVVGDRFGEAGALIVHGHHGGLAEPVRLDRSFGMYWDELEDKGQGSRLREEARANLGRLLPDVFDEATVPEWPDWLDRSDRLALEFFTRMVFSALVDADVLDTRAHVLALDEPEVRAPADMGTLLDRFTRRRESRLASRRAGALDSVQVTETDRVRNEVFEACLTAAKGTPGLYRLSAPTGAAKTMAAMGFALRHAVEHGKRRIVVAVPFMTITEQNAAVYRDLLDPEYGEPVVLEHHSNAVTGDRSAAGPGGRSDRAADWSWLAAENWDAPVVVTTTVQLFESLFGNRPGKVRKLHRLAGSVIVLDEVQALPPALLPAICDGLRRLTRDYGATVLLSSATQPEVQALTPLREVPLVEVAPDPHEWFTRLRRVRFQWWTEPRPSLDEVAAAAVDRQEPVLVVLNTLRDARTMVGSLARRAGPEVMVRHLSTAMCPAHRRVVLDEVQAALSAGHRVLLATTQMIEAGVDIDFPVVYRAIGPADSLLQAAGRANREGWLGRQGGLCVIFDPADGGMPPAYRTAIGVTRKVFGQGHGTEPDDLGLLARYFRELYRALNLEGPKSKAKIIDRFRRRLDFPSVAAEFRMIEDDTFPLVVPYGSDADRARVAEQVAELGRAGSSGRPPGRLLLRALQPYVVNVRGRTRSRPAVDQLCTPVIGDLSQWRGGYSDLTGIEFEIDPEEFMP